MFTKPTDQEYDKVNSDASPSLSKQTSCPISAISEIIGDTWILLIMYRLLEGEKRFGELLKTIPEINSRTLTLRLKKLEEIGLITRTQYNEIPPRVVYSVTKKGEKMKKLIEEITSLSKEIV